MELKIDPSAIALIGGTPATLRALLGTPPSVMLTEPNPEGWSLKEIVAHLHIALMIQQHLAPQMRNTRTLYDV
jgi:hypothetical protein